MLLLTYQTVRLCCNYYTIHSNIGRGALPIYSIQLYMHNICQTLQITLLSNCTST